MIPSGFRPVHSFDLWGVVVNQYILGQHKIEIYEEIAKRARVPKEVRKRVARNYRALLKGESWAMGPRKAEITGAMNCPGLDDEIRHYYASALMEDALCVFDEILDAGGGIVIFTSEPAPSFKEQLPTGLRERIGEIRHANKSNPASFIEIYARERSLGHIVVSHTADELPELIAARKSGLFHEAGLIYVNRNDSNPEEKVRGEGIGHYVDDLRTVDYSTIAERQPD
jgi:hypothetical protein